MLEQIDTERALAWLLVAAPLLTIGWWLFKRGVLRARHLIYVFLPLSLTLANLVVVVSEPLLSRWSAKLLFSAIGATAIMIPVLITLRFKKVDIDQLDQKRDE
jgi:hypothetical protein